MKLAKNMYADFKKKLDRIENHIAEEVAPQANELLKESVRYSLIDWYNDYTPQSYERTYNFMKILDSTRTRGKGNVLRFSVDLVKVYSQVQLSIICLWMENMVMENG